MRLQEEETQAPHFSRYLPFHSLFADLSTVFSIASSQLVLVLVFYASLQTWRFENFKEYGLFPLGRQETLHLPAGVIQAPSPQHLPDPAFKVLGKVYFVSQAENNETDRLDFPLHKSNLGPLM